jgi:UDP-glucose 4-epimerase
MTTLVTGGVGWVPSHIVRRLAAAGETVVVYDLMEPDALFDELLGEHRDRVHVEPGDVTDLAHLGETAGRHEVTSIVAAAAITPRVEREQREPARILDVNLGGTVNALEVARSLPELRRFVYISSCAAWGDVPGAAELDEETPSHAAGLYGITKHTSERVVRRYATLFDLDAISVRLANVYGPLERVTPGYSGATELREMLRLHAEGQPVRVNSLEGPYLDWTYVEDIAEGVYRLWEQPELRHDLYSLTCGRLFSIGDVLEAFGRHLPGFRHEVVPAEEANYPVSGDGPGPIPSNRRLREELGWAPDTPFDEGMRRYLDWIQRHGPQ